MKPGLGLIGRKLGMTQVFRDDGRPVQVSVLEAGPCTVVQAKTVERDGYRAAQLGFGAADPKKLSKPEAGHYAKARIGPFQVLREFRVPADQEVAVGSTVTVELFKPGDRVDVTGVSIGKGFQGGVKRWHWKGGKQTHGSMQHRAPGSIGSTTTPGRVIRGHHLPGRMGGKRVTTQALVVVRADAGHNLLLLEGSVPGYEGGIILIRKSRKKPKPLVAPEPAKKKHAAPAAGGKAAAPARGGSAAGGKSGAAKPAAEKPAAKEKK